MIWAITELIAAWLWTFTAKTNTPLSCAKLVFLALFCRLNLKPSLVRRVDFFFLKLPVQVTRAVFNYHFFYSNTATTITFNFIGPVDNGGLPIEAFAVQYKLAGDVWAEKPLQRVWPVGGGSHNQYYDLHDSISHATHTGPYYLFCFRFILVSPLSFSYHLFLLLIQIFYKYKILSFFFHIFL